MIFRIRLGHTATPDAHQINRDKPKWKNCKGNHRMDWMAMRQQMVKQLRNVVLFVWAIATVSLTRIFFTFRIPSKHQRNCHEKKLISFHRLICVSVVQCRMHIFNCSASYGIPYLNICRYIRATSKRMTEWPYTKKKKHEKKNVSCLHWNPLMCLTPIFIRSVELSTRRRRRRWRYTCNMNLSTNKYLVIII